MALWLLFAAGIWTVIRWIGRLRMSTDEAEERLSESIFADAAEPTGQDEQARCLACRVWWKVAIVLVLVAAVAGIIANKQQAADETETTYGGTNASRTLQQRKPGTTETGGDAGAAEEEHSAETVLATVNGEKITLAELESTLEEMPEQYRSAFKNNRLGLLDQLISRRLLLQQARKNNPGQNEGGGSGREKDSRPEDPPKTEDERINALLRREVFEKVKVTEEDIRRAYEELKDEMPGQRSFEEVKESLRSYVRQEKRNKAVESYLTKLQEQATITRSQEWIGAQKARAADNPLDRALATGRPVVADFGRGVCIPCKMMKPILDKLQEEYKGRADILIIEIDEYPAVTQRVGIRAIPTQIFYDAEGNEIFRHQGFMSQEAIIVKLREMGVK